MIGENVSFFKMLGIFGLIIMLVFILGGIAIGLVQSIKTGEWKPFLESTGGKLFSIDLSLKKEVTFLKESKSTNTYESLFHVSYGLSLIFILFSIGFLIFRFANWLLGIKAYSPIADVLVIIFIFLIFLLSQFAYTYFVLGESIIPLSGIIEFLINTPKFIYRMI